MNTKQNEENSQNYLYNFVEHNWGLVRTLIQLTQKYCFMSMFWLIVPKFLIMTLLDTSLAFNIFSQK